VESCARVDYKQRMAIAVMCPNGLFKGLRYHIGAWWTCDVTSLVTLSQLIPYGEGDEGWEGIPNGGTSLWRGLDHSMSLSIEKMGWPKWRVHGGVIEWGYGRRASCALPGIGTLEPWEGYVGGLRNSYFWGQGLDD
jgi:hypothetical protein